MSDADEIHTIQIPETGQPGSYEMVKCLQQIMHGVAQSLPFEFHPSDLIAAHLKCAFDLNVLNTPMSLEQTHESLVEGLNALRADAEEEKRRSN